MSKKKAFSGSTMTLKDFHGGSIPSDLPLPSAPGVAVKPLDRGGYERPIGGVWSSGGVVGTGRSDHHRPRPGSAGGGAPRGLEEGAPFLPHIGRNFDEDERKPFDASSAPRRAAAPPVDDAVRVTRLVENKPPVHQQVLAPGRPGSSPAVQLSTQGHASYGGSVAAVVGSVGHLSHPVPSHSQGPIGATVVPNAWGVKKDVMNEAPAQPVAMLSVPGAASRFAQASAIEKISSGRWQSKHKSFHQQDIEVIRFSETASGDVKFRGSNEDAADGESDKRYGERGVTDDYFDRAKASEHSEEKRKGVATNFVSDRTRPVSAEGRFTGHQQDITEVPERLKLNVLPRTKPLERLDTRALDQKQVYQSPTRVTGDGENAADIHGNQNPTKVNVTGTDVGNSAVERPKLNLLPRSQYIGHANDSVDKSREKVFGGARPREIVLKERGVDETVVSNADVAPANNRVKHEIPKIDVKQEQPSPTSRNGERTENYYPPEQRVGRDLRRDQRMDSEKTDAQRSNSWRSDNRRNAREVEKPVERRPEPDNWRKPEEQPKPSSQGLRFGKGASALELAQAFSRSVSDTRPRVVNSTSPRNIPATNNQVSYSRLTEKKTEVYSGAPRRHINGY